MSSTERMSRKDLFEMLKDKYTCISEEMPTSLSAYVPLDRRSRTVVVMPANRYVELSWVHGFVEMNGKTYAQHICIMNDHIPELHNNDSPLKAAVLATFEKTPTELPDREFFDHYYGVCEKALDLVRAHGYNVIIH